MKEFEIPLLQAAVLKSQRWNTPLIIHQTYKSNMVPERMYQSAMSWVNLNPEFEYRFYTDDSCLHFLQRYFDDQTVAAYQKLPKGAFRADFFRYCCLFIHGGVYADIDTVCRSSIYKLLRCNAGLIVPRGRLNTSFLYNAFICSKPGHPLLKGMIDRVVKKIHAGLGDCDAVTFRIFSAMFTGGLGRQEENSDAVCLSAELFGLLGPMGFGRCANLLLKRDQETSFSVSQTKIEADTIRVLRFSNRFGVLDGFRKIFDYKYEGYGEDQGATGGSNWFPSS